MITLQFPFTRDGFIHELVQRDGRVCLVRRSKPRHWHYEVVVLRVRPPEERFGRAYPERETYPSSEEWGTYGFTYLGSQLDTARERYKELVKAGCAASRG
jgi:hypothetical protein